MRDKSRGQAGAREEVRKKRRRVEDLMSEEERGKDGGSFQHGQTKKKNYSDK